MGETTSQLDILCHKVKPQYEEWVAHNLVVGKGIP